MFEFARADKKQRPSEEGKHTGYRSDEKLKNDVLLVALRSPKNSKPKAAEPQVMKSELCWYLLKPSVDLNSLRLTFCTTV